MVAVVVICAALLLAGCGGGDERKQSGGPADKGKPANPYGGLRAMALRAADLDLPSRSGGHPDVVGVVVDIPDKGGYATVVAMADGSTSLYTSVGGGLIGGGEHRPVAAANARLLKEAQSQLPRLRPSDSTEHPAARTVRIFVVTPEGRRVADLQTDEFWSSHGGRWESLVEATQGVITALRKVDPK
jgi:hypothetical protein